MGKENVLELFDEVLKKYYCAEITCIDEFSYKGIEKLHDELDSEIEGYRDRMNILINN